MLSFYFSYSREIFLTSSQADRFVNAILNNVFKFATICTNNSNVIILTIVSNLKIVLNLVQKHTFNFL